MSMGLPELASRRVRWVTNQAAPRKEESEDGVGAPVQEGEAETEDDDCSGG